MVVGSGAMGFQDVSMTPSSYDNINETIMLDLVVFIDRLTG
jgi:hypothetical protein